MVRLSLQRRFVLRELGIRCTDAVRITADDRVELAAARSDRRSDRPKATVSASIGSAKQYALRSFARGRQAD